MDTHSNEISDWQALVNKPVYSDDGEEVGIVRSIQSENLIVDYGPITPE
jgi:sporulation protein YlmC with PRC-barrel domain